MKSSKESALSYFHICSPSMNYCNIAFRDLQKLKVCTFHFYLDINYSCRKIDIFTCGILKWKLQWGSIVPKIPGKKDFQLRKPIFLNDFSSWCVVTRFPGCSNGNSFSVLLKQLSIFLLFAHFFFWMMLSKPFNWNRMNTIENFNNGLHAMYYMDKV